MVGKRGIAAVSGATELWAGHQCRVRVRTLCWMV